MTSNTGYKSVFETNHQLFSRMVPSRHMQLFWNFLDDSLVQMDFEELDNATASALPDTARAAENLNNFVRSMAGPR